MHLPPTLDSSILASHSYRRSSYRASGETNTTEPNAMEKPSTPPRPRTPIRPHKRRRTLVRVLLVLVLCVLIVVGLERAWKCGGQCTDWLARTNTNLDMDPDWQNGYVGGGSVIGTPWKGQGKAGEGEREKEGMGGEGEGQGDMELIDDSSFEGGDVTGGQGGVPTHTQGTWGEVAVVGGGDRGEVSMVGGMEMGGGL